MSSQEQYVQSQAPNVFCDRCQKCVGLTGELLRSPVTETLLWAEKQTSMEGRSTSHAAKPILLASPNGIRAASTQLKSIDVDDEDFVIVGSSFDKHLYVRKTECSVSSGTEDPTHISIEVLTQSTFATCARCAQLLQDELSELLSQLRSHNSSYQEAIAALQSDSLTAVPEADTLSTLDTEESFLCDQKAQLSAFHAQLSSEIAQLTAQNRELALREESVSRQLRILEHQLELFNEQFDQLQAQYERLTNQLRLMNSFDALRASFSFHYEQFEHSGATLLLGSVNGCRAGRIAKPPAVVEWEEINRALGHLALLLHIMAERLRSRLSTFSEYEIVPMGPRSHVRRLNAAGPVSKSSAQVVGNLYYEPPQYRLLSFQIFFMQDSVAEQFHAGVIAFAQYLAGFSRLLKPNNANPLPHPMAGGGKIGEYGLSLKYSPDNEIVWTSAMAMLLQNVEHVMHCVSVCISSS